MLTPEQESYLAKLADQGIREEAYAAKLSALGAARAIAGAKVLPQFGTAIQTLTGPAQKQAIAALQVAIDADATVSQLAAELEALKK